MNRILFGGILSVPAGSLIRLKIVLYPTKDTKDIDATYSYALHDNGEPCAIYGVLTGGDGNVVELVECAAGFYYNLPIDGLGKIPYSLPTTIFLLHKADGPIDIRQIDGSESE